MLAKGNYFKALGLGVMVLSLALAASAFLSSCATTAPQKPTMSTERQKAIQDSLRAVWDRNLNIAWSTAYEHYKNKNYKDATMYFWKVVKLDTVGRFQDVYTFFGDAFLKLNEPDSALHVYQIGTVKYPQKSQPHRMVGYLLSARQETDTAIDEYRKAIEIDPGRADDYRVLGNLLITANRTEEAIPVYQKLVEIEPNNSDAHNILAQLLASTGQEDAALDAQEIALQKDPENTNLMFSLGRAYFNRSDYQKAIDKFNQLIKLKPEDVLAWEYIGNSQQNLGQFREAIVTYEKIVSLKSDHVKAMADMATCYRELKNFPKARSVVNQAIRINPNFGLAFIVRGEIYESTVDECVSKRAKRILNYDDKLIYKLAYDEFAKAQQDPQYADLAKRKMNYIQPDIPTTEDYFMHPNETKAKGECYNWIY